MLLSPKHVFHLLRRLTAADKAFKSVANRLKDVAFHRSRRHLRRINSYHPCLSNPRWLFRARHDVTLTSHCDGRRHWTAARNGAKPDHKNSSQQKHVLRLATRGRNMRQTLRLLCVSACVCAYCCVCLPVSPMVGPAGLFGHYTYWFFWGGGIKLYHQTP